MFEEDEYRWTKKFNKTKQNHVDVLWGVVWQTSFLSWGGGANDVMWSIIELCHHWLKQWHVTYLAITWSNGHLVPVRPSGTKFSDTANKKMKNYFKKLSLKMSLVILFRLLSIRNEFHLPPSHKYGIRIWHANIFFILPFMDAIQQNLSTEFYGFSMTQLVW